MLGWARMRLQGGGGAKAAAALLVLAGLLGLAECASSGPQPQPAASAAPSPPPPPPPPPPAPPPVDLAGKWKLSAAGGAACVMTLGDSPGAAQGTIAPAGGCPGAFFTSRKWTFEHEMLVIRDHKGDALAQLSFSAGHFEGQGKDGAALTLSR
jgi:Protease inhibitor Inh